MLRLSSQGDNKWAWLEVKISAGWFDCRASPSRKHSGILLLRQMTSRIKWVSLNSGASNSFAGGNASFWKVLPLSFSIWCCYCRMRHLEVSEALDHCAIIQRYYFLGIIFSNSHGNFFPTLETSLMISQCLHFFKKCRFERTLSGIGLCKPCSSN